MTNASQSAGLAALADRIELWPIDRLRPYERNPRTHSEAQVDQIAASMVEFGWTNPVLVDEQGGVLAGHGRLLAAKKLGLVEVPVIRFEHLSEAQKRAYLLADNQLALQAGWDDALLGEELAWLRDERFDLDLVGFDATELERLLGIADGEGGSDDTEDEVPEPPEEPVSRAGDLWILGNHRLLCGDATVLTDVERVLGGQLADMTFCDPPYNVDYASSPKDKQRGKNRPILNDALGSGFEAFLYDACVNILSVTKGACYICMSSSELDTLQRAFRAAGGHWSTFVIWAKNTFTLGRADYQRQYEPILYGWPEGHDRYWCGARDQGDVWFIDKPARNDLQGRDPLAPLQDVINDEGDIVVPVDPRYLGLWLTGLFGDPATTDNLDGSWDHVFASGGDTLPSYTVEVGMPKVPAFFLHAGVKLNSMALEFTRSGPAAATVNAIAQGETRFGATQGGTPTSLTFSRISQFQGSIKRAGNPVGNLTAGSVTYSNNLEKIETIRDDGLIEGADPTIAALTGQIDVRFADTTLIDLAAGGTPVDLEFAYTLSAQAKLVLTAHEVYLPKPKLAVEGPGGVQASFDFRGAKNDAAGQMLTVTLTNDLDGTEYA